MTMSPDNHKPAAKPTGKSETQSSTGRKTAQEPALKCPRCDSPNTKFCYYNNYSLAQPRHFCKTCRRYWTRGGALRNVPIGGGCRKNKKMKPSSPRLVSGDSTDVGGLKLFQGISPAMDFQLQGVNFPQNTPLLNHFPSFGEISNAISSNFPGNMNHSHGIQEMGSLNLQSTLANSIESLSSINQDLHLKLQQQRLSMLFVNNHKENSTNLHFVEKPEPILFQNLDISKATESCGIGKKDGNLSTEWFFDNSYANGNPNPEIGGSNVNENNSNWSGVQAWSDMAQFTSLP